MMVPARHTDYGLLERALKYNRMVQCGWSTHAGSSSGEVVRCCVAMIGHLSRKQLRSFLATILFCDWLWHISYLWSAYDAVYADRFLSRQQDRLKVDVACSSRLKS